MVIKKWESPVLAGDYIPYILNTESLAHVLRMPYGNLVRVLRTQGMNYRYQRFEIPKKSGGSRIIHQPHRDLHFIQKRILRYVLNPLQAQLGKHVAAYRKRLNIPSAVAQHIPNCPLCNSQTPSAHACPKLGLFISLDLVDFFPSTYAISVYDYFKALGFNKNICWTLTHLITVQPKDDKALCGAIIPQGAPTSGAICNLVADKLIDTPIIKYLQDLGNHYHLTDSQKWVYTRYADDINITCGIRLPPQDINNIITNITRIINAAHYAVNARKTRYVYGTYYQRKMLGVVFNAKMTYEKKKAKKLRAILHNCRVHGFDTQYTKAGKKSVEELKTYLTGTINWVAQIDATKGASFQAAYDRALAAEELKQQGEMNG